jgi:hypothetical protein
MVMKMTESSENPRLLLAIGGVALIGYYFYSKNKSAQPPPVIVLPIVNFATIFPASLILEIGGTGFINGGQPYTVFLDNIPYPSQTTTNDDILDVTVRSQQYTTGDHTVTVKNVTGQQTPLFTFTI